MADDPKKTGRPDRSKIAMDQDQRSVQDLDTSTPAGRAMFQMMGVCTGIERAILRKRTMAGLRGRTLKEADIRLLRAEAIGIQKICAHAWYRSVWPFNG